MPHFIVDCSETILEQKSAEVIMETIHKAADATGLFDPDDIKVRINPFGLYLIANKKQDFIHVFGNIMEGRTDDQKNNLSRSIVRELKLLFAEAPVISMNIRDFEKASYCKKDMV